MIALTDLLKSGNTSLEYYLIDKIMREDIERLPYEINFYWSSKVAFRKNKIHTIGELLHFTETDLLKMNGIRQATLTSIKVDLSKLGLTLKGE